MVRASDSRVRSRGFDCRPARYQVTAKQYNLVTTKGGDSLRLGGLASHWPCITDFVVYPPTGSMAKEREISTRPTLSPYTWHDSLYPYSSMGQFNFIRLMIKFSLLYDHLPIFTS